MCEPQPARALIETRYYSMIGLPISNLLTVPQPIIKKHRVDRERDRNEQTVRNWRASNLQLTYYIL